MTMPAETVIADRLLGLNLPPLTAISGPGFQVEAWIADALAQRAWMRTDALPVFYRLSRKIEVARHLYRGYDAGIAKATEAAPLTPAAVESLCALFLAWSEFHQDPRFLNTVLKTQAGILLSPQVCLSPALTAWAMLLLETLPLAA